MICVAKFKLAAAIIVAATVVTGGGVAVVQQMAQAELQTVPSSKDAAPAVALAQGNDGVQADAGKRPVSGNGVVGGLEAKISFARDAYRVGEPIEMIWERVNVGGEDVTVISHFAVPLVPKRHFDFLRVRLVHQETRKTTTLRFSLPRDTVSKIGCVLRSGEKLVHRIDLSEWVRLRIGKLEPGEYDVAAVYEVPAETAPIRAWMSSKVINSGVDDLKKFEFGEPREVWKGTLCSNSVKITLAEQPWFTFSTGGRHHFEGYGEWVVTLTETGVMSVTHWVRDTAKRYGPYKLNERERAEVDALIQRAESSGLESSTRPGVPDSVKWTLSFKRKDETTTYRIWAHDAEKKPEIRQLAAQLGTLVRTHTKQQPVGFPKAEKDS